MSEIVAVPQKNKPFTSAVIGLGNIGMGYDFNLPSCDYVYSHVRALQQNTNFQLIGAVDPDLELQQSFRALTGLPAYGCLKNLLVEMKPEVIIIAAPTSTHRSLLEEILGRYHPRAILCEKPLAVTGEDSRWMYRACQDARVPIFINFIRRADPAVQEIRNRIAKGVIATPLKAVVWYSKGMFHNGSHFVDLMSYWLGSILSVRLISSGRNLGFHDAEPDFEINFQYGSAIYCSAMEENFSHYTVEMVASNGRMRYERDGVILWQNIEKDQLFSGYSRLSDASEAIFGDVNRYQLRVLDELFLALRGEACSLCSAEDAAINMAWLEQLFQNRS